MRGGDLPEGDSIVRYVKPSMIRDDGKVSSGCFRLQSSRPDETGLSVNWLEAFEPDKENQLNQVRRLCRLELRKNGRFAELNVGEVKRVVSRVLESLRIVHAPLELENDFEGDPSHAEIINLPKNNSPLCALVSELIEVCIIELHPTIIDQ